MARNRNISSKGRQETGKFFNAHGAEDASPDTLPPIFCLQYLQPEYCLSKCEKEEKSAFADRLYRLSQMTWTQIKCAHRHKLGFENIERTAIRAGIPKHITPDVTLIAFRFYDKAPMVGYRNKRIFHIVWLDRTYSLYDHG